MKLPTGEYAQKILQVLEGSRTQSGVVTRPMTWTELKQALQPSSHGTLGKPLIGLIRNGYVRKELGKYSLTFEGRWVLKKGLTESPSLDPLLKRLMEIHGYVEFTPAQSEFFVKERQAAPHANICIFASPDMGKTLMAELCMTKDLKRNGRILYLTPYKALNREKHQIFTEVFHDTLGHSVARADGDAPTQLSILEKSHIVVATFERAYIGLVLKQTWALNRTVVIADEITLLRDPNRGPELDLLLTMFLTMQRTRIIALSSHFRNEQDVADWLNAKNCSYPHQRGREEFVITRSKSNLYIEDRDGLRAESIQIYGSLEQTVYDYINAGDGKRLLFLVGTRHLAERTAERLCQGKQHRAPLDIDISTLEKTDLIDLLLRHAECGVAFHHAGLPYLLRAAIEDGVRSGKLDAVASTPTLSHGINLPFNVVVLYLDSFTRDFGLSGLSRIEYEQYTGRARASMSNIPTQIYVVADSKEQVRNGVWSAPFEPIEPATVSEDCTEKVVIYALTSRARKEKEVIKHATDFLRETAGFRCARSPWSLDVLTEVALSNLVKGGFVSKRRELISLTRRGRTLALTGFNSGEEKWIREILFQLKDWQETRITVGLLRLASDVGLAKEFEQVGRPELKTWLLLSWIEERPLAEIVQKVKGRCSSFRDQDVARLALDTAAELTKIVQIAMDMRLPKLAALAQELVTRLRYGIKSDLASSDLFLLGSMNRQIARKLYDNDLKSLFQLYDLQSDSLLAFSKKLDIPHSAVQRIHGEVFEKAKRDRKWRRAYVRWKKSKRSFQRGP